MAEIIQLDKFRTRHTKIHPHSLSALNNYAKLHPYDEVKHNAAWKIVNEFPNKPMSLKTLSEKLGDDIVTKILEHAGKLKW